MSAWLKRFGLHLAAAVGATGIFVAAAAVGATQTREQTGVAPPTVTLAASRTPRESSEPSRPAAAGIGSAGVTPTPGAGADGATPPTPLLGSGGPTPPVSAGGIPSAAAPAVSPERSLAGTIQEVAPDGQGELLVLGVGGRTWRVAPAPGALIRLNGKSARLDALQPGDKVVILGQAQVRQRGQVGNGFLAHAITARRS